MRGTTAERWCSESKTPTPPATVRSRTSSCSRRCSGSASTGTRASRRVGPMRPTVRASAVTFTRRSSRSSRPLAISTSRSSRARRWKSATRLPAATRARATTTTSVTSPTSSVKRSRPRAVSRACDCACRTKTSRSPTSCAARSHSRPGHSPTSSSFVRTVLRSTRSSILSTTRSWASRTCCAAKTCSRRRRVRSRSTAH